MRDKKRDGINIGGKDSITEDKRYSLSEPTEKLLE